MPKKIMKFSTIVILMLVLIVLALTIVLDYAGHSKDGASLTFRNESGLTINSATINLSGQACAVKKLEDKGEIRCFFGDLYDSSYDVQVELINGARFKSNNMGYVTSRINFNDVITINKAGEINLHQKNN